MAAGVFFVLGALCLCYFGVVACFVDLNNKFTYFWLLLGVCFLAAGGICRVFRQKQIHPPVWFTRLGLVVVGCILVGFLAIEGTLIVYGQSKPAQGAEYMIVLGARVKGQKVTINLARRLDTAYQYLQKNPETTVILSGGQGSGEEISEAEAMQRYLQKKGIDPSRMILEDRSTNTDENLAFSMRKIPSTDARTVIVTNDFHVYRALRIAKKKGLRNVQGAGSTTRWYTVPNMYVREAFAVLKYTVCGQI